MISNQWLQLRQSIVHTPTGCYTHFTTVFQPACQMPWICHHGWLLTLPAAMLNCPTVLAPWNSSAVQMVGFVLPCPLPDTSWWNLNNTGYIQVTGHNICNSHFFNAIVITKNEKKITEKCYRSSLHSKLQMQKDYSNNRFSLLNGNITIQNTTNYWITSINTSNKHSNKYHLKLRYSSSTVRISTVWKFLY